MASQPVIVGAVCARKGSTGLLDKNIRHLGGRSLIGRACDVARASMCEVVVLSTDYDLGAFPWLDGSGVQYLHRPANLAGGQIPKWPVYQNILAWAEGAFPGKPIDAIVDIDVSRPFRTADDVDACITAWWRNSYADTVMAVTHARKSPYFDIVEVDPEGRSRISKRADPPFTNRQDLPPAYYHGGVYVVGADALRIDAGLWEGKVYACEVDELAGFDVDDPLDWTIAEALVGREAKVCQP